MSSAFSSPAKTDSGTSKRPSVKWTEKEQETLVAAIARQGRDRVNWGDIAKLLPGRTGKQCREKWKNDLRPDICKDPWTSKEEYILARLHSDVGNQWAEIAKYLAGRSENSIKNHWNATLRSKAGAKGKTLLGAYGKMVLEQQGTTGPETFGRACDFYASLRGVEPLEAMQVPNEYFQRRCTPHSATSTPVKVNFGRQARQPRAAAARKRSRARDDDTTDSETEEAEDNYCDDDDLPKRSRRPSAAASRRQSSCSLPPLPPHQTVPHAAYAFPNIGHELYHGDVAATIKISDRGSKVYKGPTTGHQPYGASVPYPMLPHSSTGIFYPGEHMSAAALQQLQQLGQAQGQPEAPDAESDHLLLGLYDDDGEAWSDMDLAFLREMVEHDHAAGTTHSALSPVGDLCKKGMGMMADVPSKLPSDTGACQDQDFFAGDARCNGDHRPTIDYEHDVYASDAKTGSMAFAPPAGFGNPQMINISGSSRTTAEEIAPYEQAHHGTTYAMPGHHWQGQSSKAVPPSYFNAKPQVHFMPAAAPSTRPVMIPTKVDTAAASPPAWSEPYLYSQHHAVASQEYQPQEMRAVEGQWLVQPHAESGMPQYGQFEEGATQAYQWPSPPPSEHMFPGLCMDAAIRAEVAEPLG